MDKEDPIKIWRKMILKKKKKNLFLIFITIILDFSFSFNLSDGWRRF